MLQPEIAFLFGVVVGAISLVAAAWALRANDKLDTRSLLRSGGPD